MRRTPISPEYMTVANHHAYIFRQHYWDNLDPKMKARVGDMKSYQGMPFFDEWNPDKGGSFIAGEKWIIENLGRRPVDNFLMTGQTVRYPGQKSRWQMHILDRPVGFVPGNLAWMPTNKHNRLEAINLAIVERGKELANLNSQIISLAVSKMAA